MAVVGRSRLGVEGLFDKDQWYPGSIESIKPGRNGNKIIVVHYEDSTRQTYDSHKATDMHDLRYDQTNEKPETHQWNICHHLLCDERFKWSPSRCCPLTHECCKGSAVPLHLQWLLERISSGECASDAENLVNVRKFLIDIAQTRLNAASKSPLLVVSSEWAEYFSAHIFRTPPDSYKEGGFNSTIHHGRGQGPCQSGVHCITGKTYIEYWRGYIEYYIGYVEILGGCIEF